MNKYKDVSFINLVLRFELFFFIAILIIRPVFKFFSSGFDVMKAEYLADGKWQYFLVSSLVMSFIYGLLMAGYYKFIKK